MAWYDKYYNKITKTGDFWLEIKTERLCQENHQTYSIFER